MPFCRQLDRSSNNAVVIMHAGRGGGSARGARARGETARPSGERMGRGVGGSWGLSGMIRPGWMIGDAGARRMRWGGLETGRRWVGGWVGGWVGARGRGRGGWQQPLYYCGCFDPDASRVWYGTHCALCWYDSDDGNCALHELCGAAFILYWWWGRRQRVMEGTRVCCKKREAACVGPSGSPPGAVGATRMSGRWRGPATAALLPPSLHVECMCPGVPLAQQALFFSPVGLPA
jgi:hypothetical protein